MIILLYLVLRAGRAQFVIWTGFSSVYFTLCSPRSGPRTIWDIRWGFLASILLYVVLGAGHAQFGIFGRVFSVYFTLCSPRSGSRTICDVI